MSHDTAYAKRSHNGSTDQLTLAVACGLPAKTRALSLFNKGATVRHSTNTTYYTVTDPVHRIANGKLKSVVQMPT